MLFRSGRGGSTAGGTAGSTREPFLAVPLAVEPLGGGGSTATGRSFLPENAIFRDFGRKNDPKMAKSKGQMMELGYGNAKEGRSTSIAIDLWIKTCKNALESQIGPKAIWGYFWWKFSNFSK